MTSDREKVKAWIQASRPPFFIATLIPLTIGWILAAHKGDWHIRRFLLVILGALMVHLATNLANDYFDHLQGTDAGESIGGSRVIQEGKISPNALAGAIVLAYSLASLVAFYLMITLNLWAMLPLLLLALFSSIFYVAPPIRYGYRGLGELFVGINMGPTMVVGTYWVIAGKPGWEPFYISLTVGLMVAAILYYQSLPDMKTDAAAGKNTLAVLLGKKRAFEAFIILWIAIYLSILVLVISGLLSCFAFASLATSPIFIRLLGIIKRTQDWVHLDQYGNYVRMLYFFNGLVIVISLLL
ncbi:MAG: 1,4-dihydroxy-2-naphthoate octaprenyltransferase [Desulfobacterales bacterium]|nr:1,4-dihydroxy-2-naphthoate octaprenyltransferase [Desulfobacterales bacterium]